MPTDVFPNITVPVTSVVWIYSGMLPQQVEGRITYLFERFLTSTVEGIKYIHSHSYYGSSITNIYLQDGVDVGRAEADIVGIAQTVVKALPPDISPPMVMRLAPSSIPVAMLEISSDTMTPAELYNLAYMRIRPLLVTVPGIVLPHPYGGQDMQVMVNLDRYGNTSAASVPVALDEARREGRIRRGDIVLLNAFGAGFAWGAAVIRF
jgi:multidrug efflux pump subunit AcrB